MASDDLASLRNLGPTSARRLRAVSIETVDCLIEVGPAVAYFRVARAFPQRTSHAMLWALFGALVDLDWRDLPHAERERLLAEVAALDR